MEPPSKTFGQIVFIKRPKTEEHILTVMEKSTRGGRLARPTQTSTKQVKIAITFLKGYNGYLLLQIQITIYISQNQLLIKMVLFKLLFHRELIKSKV